MGVKQLRLFLLDEVIVTFGDPFRSEMFHLFAPISTEAMLQSANSLIARSAKIIIFAVGVPSISNSILGPLISYRGTPSHGTH